MTLEGYLPKNKFWWPVVTCATQPPHFAFVVGGLLSRCVACVAGTSFVGEYLALPYKNGLVGAPSSQGRVGQSHSEWLDLFPVFYAFSAEDLLSTSEKKTFLSWLMIRFCILRAEKPTHSRGCMMAQPTTQSTQPRQMDPTPRQNSSEEKKGYPADRAGDSLQILYSRFSIKYISSGMNYRRMAC